MKMKICPQFEAVTVTAKQLTFLDSALNLEEKMPSNLWGVSSLSKNRVFLKCVKGYISIFLAVWNSSNIFFSVQTREAVVIKY